MASKWSNVVGSSMKEDSKSSSSTLPPADLSVRPKTKFTTKKQEKVGESLDKKIITFYDRSGFKHTTNAIDPRFCPSIVFPKFFPPPLMVSNADTNGQQHNQQQKQLRMDRWINDTTLLESSLQQLLRLPYHRFWSTVVNEISLQVALDSYLRNTPVRQHHVSVMTGEGIESYSDNVKQAIVSIHNLVLLVFVRMMTLNESTKNLLTPKALGNITTKHNLFDLGRLLDLLSTYWLTCGDDGKHQLRALFDTVTDVCPNIVTNELPELVSVIISFLDELKDRLGVDYHDNNQVDSSRISKISCVDLLNIMSAITDFTVSVYCLSSVSNVSFRIFHENNIEQTIIHFYESVFPSIQRQVDKRFTLTTHDSLTNGFHQNLYNQETDKKTKKDWWMSDDTGGSNDVQVMDGSVVSLDSVRKHVLRTKCMLIMTCRQIIYGSMIQPLLDPNIDCSRKSLYVDALFDIMTLIQSEKHFFHDYSKKFPLRLDVNLLRDNSLVTGFADFDSERFRYLIINEPTTKTTTEIATQTPVGLPSTDNSVINNDRSNKRKDNETPAVEANKQSSADNQQSKKSSKNKSSNKKVTTSSESPVKIVTDSTTNIKEIELLSLISGVKDILGDLGDGFIMACLEKFKYNMEITLNALLTDDLPQDIKDLNRLLSKDQWNDMKSKNEKPKLIDDVLNTRKSIYDGDEFDILRNDNVDVTRIHRGKKDKVSKIESEKLDLDLKAKTKAFNEQQLIREEEEELAALAKMGITDSDDLFIG